MPTRNQIAAFFHSFRVAHYQLKDDGYGDFPEVGQSRGMNYPIIWVNPQPVTIDGNEFSHEYVIAIADRVLSDESNELEVESDTFQIGQDLLAFLDDQSDHDWEIETDGQLVPFTEKWKDDVAGWLLTVSIKTNFDYDSCAVPSSGVGPDPDPTNCSPGTLEVNGDEFTTIPSGGTFDLVVKYDTGDVAPGVKTGNEYIVPASGTCSPATAVIKDSSGTTLKTESINSGVSENITINDSVAVLKNTANTTILSENIKAEASENITIPNVAWTDSDGSVESSAYGTSIVCTPAAAQAGVLFKGWPDGQQYDSYRTGDAGSRLQTGWYNYTKPAYPKVYAELDWSLGANGWARLKNNLVVGGVSSKLRFVDVAGAQVFSGTGDKDRIVIDKFTGIGYYRKWADITSGRTWNQAIDDALAFSTVVNGVTYSDFYLWSMEDQQALFGTYMYAGGINFTDPISGAVLLVSNFGAADFLWTSSTAMNSGGANAQIIICNTSHVIFSAGKGGAYLPVFIFDARSLISSP